MLNIQKLCGNILRKPRYIAQENKSYIFPRGSTDILNILPEKVHYSFNLVSRALPVLGRKCIECHAFNSKLPRPVDGLFKNGGTLLVPKAPREAAFFRPPAVAVHYYADMLRNINLSHQIDMISLSLSAPTASMVSIYLSVIF